MKITNVDMCVTVISEELAELRNGGEPDMTGPEAHQPCPDSIERENCLKYSRQITSLSLISQFLLCRSLPMGSALCTIKAAWSIIAVYNLLIPGHCGQAGAVYYRESFITSNRFGPLNVNQSGQTCACTVPVK